MNLLSRLNEIDTDYLKTRASILKEEAAEAAAAASAAARAQAAATSERAAAAMHEYAGQAFASARSSATVCRSAFGEFCDFTLERCRTFDAFDFAIFKLCLVFFGAWFAAQFTKLAKRLKKVFLIGFLVSLVYLVWRIFFAEQE